MVQLAEAARGWVPPDEVKAMLSGAPPMLAARPSTPASRPPMVSWPLVVGLGFLLALLALGYFASR